MYFGSWREDRDGKLAEERFDHEWPYLKKGEHPPSVDVAEGCTLKQLCFDFLDTKKAQLDAGELSQRSFRDYFVTCKLLADTFGKERKVAALGPADFRTLRANLAERLGPVSLRNTINRICSVFNHAYPNRLIDKPFDGYGTAFTRPPAKALRKDRNEAGAKLFERDEVIRLLDAADLELKAMILLGLNCAFGNSDIAHLSESDVDQSKGWVSLPRTKTQIPRRIPLWPETLAALDAALAVRPAPATPTARGLCFLTRSGLPLVRVQLRKEQQDDTMPATDNSTPPEAGPGHIPIDVLSGRFSKLLKKLHINGRRGLGFYTLRHCFETYGGECRDQVAVDAIMGHVDSTMAGNYRHRISDERLMAAVEAVRTWLYADASDNDTEIGAA
jgi:integrase